MAMTRTFPSKRAFLATVLCVTAATAAGCPAKDDPDDAIDHSTDRAFSVGVLTLIAEPVLEAMAEGELKQRLPVNEWERERAAFTHLQAFARTLAGIAPWLELGPDSSFEGKERARLIDLAQRSLINATDPRSPDFLTFSGEQGDQPLVEAAYLSSALLHAPTQLWEALDEPQRANVVAALRAARGIELVHDDHWILYPAMIEAALWRFTGEVDLAPIERAVETFENDWYLGDGVYGDGPELRWDYYNSYVIHPMLLQVLRVAESQQHAIAASLEVALPRALRYAEILERQVSPEGTFPVMGRSSAYRFAAFHHLAYMALRGDLPEEVDPGAARAAITTVVRRMIVARDTFDEAGWLQLGAVGYQPGLQEPDDSTGSLYVALTGLVHLGLPADDDFWTAPPAPWTQQRIWSGEDVPRDEALTDEAAE
jgi:hypothetical protein